MPETYISKCPCGALCLEVAGKPVHNHACTCTRCQRTSGSVIGAFAWFPEDNVRVLTGAYTTWYPEGEIADNVMKAFCPICGGGGFARSGDYLPGTLCIAVGTFADPGFPQPDHVHWWGNRPGWIGIAEEIERLPGN